MWSNGRHLRHHFSNVNVISMPLTECSFKHKACTDHSVLKASFWHVRILATVFELSTCPFMQTIFAWCKLYTKQWHKTRSKQWAQSRLRLCLAVSVTTDFSELYTIYRMSCNRSGPCVKPSMVLCISSTLGGLESHYSLGASLVHWMNNTHKIVGKFVSSFITHSLPECICDRQVLFTQNWAIFNNPTTLRHFCAPSLILHFLFCIPRNRSEGCKAREIFFLWRLAVLQIRFSIWYIMKCADILAFAATVNFKKQSYLFEPLSVNVSCHWLHCVWLLALWKYGWQSGIKSLLGNSTRDSSVD